MENNGEKQVHENTAGANLFAEGCIGMDADLRSKSIEMERSEIEMSFSECEVIILYEVLKVYKYTRTP